VVVLTVPKVPETNWRRERERERESVDLDVDFRGWIAIEDVAVEGKETPLEGFGE
jgi:hypothetical protein